ncbi:hypothetical protein TNCV_110781 [Trichonephila clavipes]|nr:hypothetical protein TNCV_110781 [Trichonephila clavipes]
MGDEQLGQWGEFLSRLRLHFFPANPNSSIRVYTFTKRGRFSQAFRYRKFCFSSCRSFCFPLRPLRGSPSLGEFVITDELIYDNLQSVTELINLRDSYAIWARKLSIVPATSDEYTATSAELENIPTALLAAKERMNLPLFRLPISIETLDALIKKVEEQRAHPTPVDFTPKETVPSDTTLNSPSKRTLKNLRLKTDKKRQRDPRQKTYRKDNR